MFSFFTILTELKCLVFWCSVNIIYGQMRTSTIDEGLNNLARSLQFCLQLCAFVQAKKNAIFSLENPTIERFKSNCLHKFNTFPRKLLDVFAASIGRWTLFFSDQNVITWLDYYLLDATNFAAAHICTSVFLSLADLLSSMMRVCVVVCPHTVYACRLFFSVSCIHNDWVHAKQIPHDTR